MLIGSFQRWQGTQKTLIYLESHGRGEILEDAERPHRRTDPIDISRTVGWFTSFYPFLLELPEQKDLTAQIQHVKAHLRKIPHKGIGFGILKYLSDLDPQEAEKLQGKARIGFNYLGQFDQDIVSDLFEVTPESTGSWASPRSQPIHDLYIEGIILQQHLEMTLHYHPGQYQKESTSALWQYYQKELEQLIAHCQ